MDVVPNEKQESKQIHRITKPYSTQSENNKEQPTKTPLYNRFDATQEFKTQVPHQKWQWNLDPKGHEKKLLKNLNDIPVC